MGGESCGMRVKAICCRRHAFTPPLPGRAPDTIAVHLVQLVSVCVQLTEAEA